MDIDGCYRVIKEEMLHTRQNGGKDNPLAGIEPRTSCYPGSRPTTRL